MWTDPGPGVTPPSPAQTLETTLLLTGVQGSGSAILTDLTRSLTLTFHSITVTFLFFPEIFSIEKDNLISIPLDKTVLLILQICVYENDEQSSFGFNFKLNSRARQEAADDDI